jgi:hypothetical protein
VKELRRYATLVAALTAPLLAIFEHTQGRSWAASVLIAVVGVAAFRGALDLALRNLTTHEALTLDADVDEMDADALRTRRAHFWIGKFKLVAWYFVICFIYTLVKKPEVIMHGRMYFGLIFPVIHAAKSYGNLHGADDDDGHLADGARFEPGDADFGVKLDDVRGQKEAKEEIRKVVTLWQSGEQFVKPAASASAASSSSARRAPARRCSPRPSPPASTPHRD